VTEGITSDNGCSTRVADTTTGLKELTVCAKSVLKNTNGSNAATTDERWFMMKDFNKQPSLPSPTVLG
jgi:hypothetical protein